MSIIQARVRDVAVLIPKVEEKSPWGERGGENRGENLEESKGNFYQPTKNMKVIPLERSWKCASDALLTFKTRLRETELQAIYSRIPSEKT